MESIHHHRQFLGLLCPYAALDRSRVRSMGDPTGMQGNHAFGDVFPAHEVSIYIVQKFVTVDITVIIRCGNRLGVIIEETGTERTYDKIMPFKSLVHRRGLMHPTRNRFEVMDAESKRITTTIPSNYIKRMMAIMDSIDPPFLFCL